MARGAGSGGGESGGGESGGADKGGPPRAPAGPHLELQLQRRQLLLARREGAHNRGRQRRRPAGQARRARGGDGRCRGRVAAAAVCGVRPGEHVPGKPLVEQQLDHPLLARRGARAARSVAAVAVRGGGDCGRERGLELPLQQLEGVGGDGVVPGARGLLQAGWTDGVSWGAGA
jgi:hypothetical protein